VVEGEFSHVSFARMGHAGVWGGFSCGNFGLTGCVVVEGVSAEVVH
jgi:hypothetical protein